MAALKGISNLKRLKRELTTPERQLINCAKRKNTIIGGGDNRFIYKAKKRKKGDQGGADRYHFHEHFGKKLLPDDEGEWLTAQTIAKDCKIDIDACSLRSRIKAANCEYDAPLYEIHREGMRGESAWIPEDILERFSEQLRLANDFLIRTPAGRSERGYLVDGYWRG